MGVIRIPRKIEELGGKTKGNQVSHIYFILKCTASVVTNPVIPPNIIIDYLPYPGQHVNQVINASSNLVFLIH